MLKEAVLFDLGNTLIEFPPPEKLRENLVKHVDHMVTEKDVLDRMHELLMEERRAGFQTFKEATIKNALSRALREHGYHLSDSGVFARIGEIYLYGFRMSATLIEGADELLSYLEARGIKMGIVSNTPFPGYLFRGEMARFGIERYFQTFVWSSEFGIRKPSPAIFHKAMDDLNISNPKDVAFVGDKLDRDVAGSRGVGMTSIWFDRKGTGHNHDGHRVTSLKEIPHLPGLF